MARLHTAALSMPVTDLQYTPSKLPSLDRWFTYSQLYSTQRSPEFDFSPTQKYVYEWEKSLS